MTYRRLEWRAKNPRPGILWLISIDFVNFEMDGPDMKGGTDKTA